MAKIQDDAPMHVDDLFELIMEFKKQYRNVFVYQVDSQVYIYRALGRKEYKDILSDKRFNDFEKEEIICDTCLLYPSTDTIDWDAVDAGIPTELMKQIRKNSYLDNKKSRKGILDYYRAEMYDLDNQITCIINEAFPQFDIEDIEEWDVEKTMKYLTRAEWKLTNLHGLQFKDAEGDFYGEEGLSAEDETIYPVTQEITPQTPRQEQTNLRGGDKRNKLTPDKMREREEFLRKFPMFAGHDDGMDGIKGLEQSGVDTTSPALRPGF